MKYLLDTNDCIRYLQGRSPVIRDAIHNSHHAPY
jgi:predicted nucleic acid-binding protein